MSPVSSIKRPVQIGDISGGFSDRVFAITQLAKDSDVVVIMGDVCRGITLSTWIDSWLNEESRQFLEEFDHLMNPVLIS